MYHFQPTYTMTHRISGYTIIFFICLLSIPSLAWRVQPSSTNDKTALEAVLTYERIQPKLGIQEEYRLLLKGQTACYQHFQVPRSYENDKGWKITLDRDYYQWYFDQTHQTVVHQRKLSNGVELISRYPADPIEWTIHDETKTLAGYTVQKATTLAFQSPNGLQVEGAKAVAWFAPEIPLGVGPERYHGLPGLIVQLQLPHIYTDYTLTDFTKQSLGDIEPQTGVSVEADWVTYPREFTREEMKAFKR
jgi:GLPGLI family protein